MRSNGNYGEIYYTEDKNGIFFDIVIPDNWKETIKEVDCVKAILDKNYISIACYDHGNNFIPSSVSPLPKLERLLLCFVLIFSEKLLSNEKFLYTAMDYFSIPTLEKFKDTYIDFLSEPKYTYYHVAYKDDYDEDLDGFSQLSLLYKNFIANIDARNKQ